MTDTCQNCGFHVELSPRERRVLERENDKAENAAIDALLKLRKCRDENRRLLIVKDAADHLWRQLHNLKTATPKWANDAVCSAMVKLGNTLNAIEFGTKGPF